MDAKLWSDEKKFEMFNSKRHQTCRRKKGESLCDDTIQGTVKHGGGPAMFWAVLEVCRLVTFFRLKEL